MSSQKEKNIKKEKTGQSPAKDSMEKQIAAVVEQLRQRGQTLAFAESCTGGWLSSKFTEQSGVSDVFLGSIVAYSNGLKAQALQVPQHLFTTVGAVSRPVALSMAHGAKVLTKATWAVSITGIAGPKGGTKKKPVGTVCLAVVGPGFERATIQKFSGNRMQVQQSSAEFAVRWFSENL